MDGESDHAVTGGGGSEEGTGGCADAVVGYCGGGQSAREDFGEEGGVAGVEGGLNCLILRIIGEGDASLMLFYGDIDWRGLVSERLPTFATVCEILGGYVSWGCGCITAKLSGPLHGSH